LHTASPQACLAEPGIPIETLPGRRLCLKAGLAWAAGTPLALFPPVVAATELAAPWPERPIHLIVPWPPGGGTDLTMRVLAEEAGVRLGQPVVILNRPGAAGTLVAPLLKAAAPDGYTIGQLPVTVLRFSLMNRVAWDPLADLAPILQVSGTTFGLLVAADSPWKTVHDLLDWARAHPNELMLGSTGVGTTPHLAMAELLQRQGIAYTHIPYKGTPDQMLALASGSIMAGMNSTGFAPWVDQGKLRLLAFFSAARSPRWPNVPTMSELGFADTVYNSAWGLAAPTGTPRAILNVLHQAFKAAMFTPRHLEELARYDQQADYLGPEAYRAALSQTLAQERAMLTRMKMLAPPSP
jgi:tripartite-type tricarboxylate transporter receptor subunit TctC